MNFLYLISENAIFAQIYIYLTKIIRVDLPSDYTVIFIYLKRTSLLNVGFHYLHELSLMN